MLIATNNHFAIPLIPECNLSGLRQWAELNNLQITDTPKDNLEYFVPYRNSYDRIIRGLGADWHELLIDHNIVNLNISKWEDVKDTALAFINDWLAASPSIPVQKHHRHTAYYISYITPEVFRTGTFFDVSQAHLLPALLNNKYNTNFSLEIPEHSDEFYSHTVPFWEVDALYHSNSTLRTLIDNYQEYDTIISVTDLT